VIDYVALKQRVSITKALHMLGVDLVETGAQLRGRCPACNADERGLVVTPDKGLFYCFNGKKGGDQISLVAHIRKCSVKEAGLFLAGEESEAEPVKTDDAGGLPAPFCKQTGIAFAKQKDMDEAVKVTWKKPAKVPMRSETGQILGYLFIETAMVSKGVL
jgi:hypothetical protein